MEGKSPPTQWRRYTIQHDTTYCYAYAVSHARHRSHLIPRELANQRVHDFSMDINQELSESRTQTDFFGNRLHDFTISKPHRLLEVCVRMDVSVTTPPWPESSVIWHGESLARRRFEPGDVQGRLFAMNCAQFLSDSPKIPSLPEAQTWATRHIDYKGLPLHEQLLLLTKAFYEDFDFDSNATSVGTPLSEVLINKRGVCQDFAHAFIAILRALGIPARYASGYILTHPPPGQERLLGADATHAWVEAWCPGHGWLGLDPTNGKAVTDEFVKLADGRDYTDVIPLRGVVVGGGEHTLEVSVTMLPEAASSKTT